MIVYAMCENNCVYAFNEHNTKILNVSGQLYNYTSKSVAVKIDNKVIIYNDKGNEITRFPKEPIDVSNITNIIL